MTGRGMGFCAGFANAVRGFFGGARRGAPLGRGMGRGWCRNTNSGFPSYRNSNISAQDEKERVNEEIKALQSELEDLKKYLADLDKDQK